MGPGVVAARLAARRPPELVLVGVGASLPSTRFGPPRATCIAALEHLDAAGVRIVHRSRWYESAPVPPSDQPWYVNGVAAVSTDRSPKAVLGLLHSIEREFGRERRAV